MLLPLDCSCPLIALAARLTDRALVNDYIQLFHSKVTAYKLPSIFISLIRCTSLLVNV